VSPLSFLIVLAVLAIAGRPSRRNLLASAALSALLFAGIAYTQYAGNSWGFPFPLHEGWSVAANGWWGLALFGLAALLVALRRVGWVAPIATSSS
jgi:hypothetical protein